MLWLCSKTLSKLKDGLVWVLLAETQNKPLLLSTELPHGSTRREPSPPRTRGQPRWMSESQIPTTNRARWRRRSDGRSRLEGPRNGRPRPLNILPASSSEERRRGPPPPPRGPPSPAGDRERAVWYLRRGLPVPPDFGSRRTGPPASPAAGAAAAANRIKSNITESTTISYNTI